MYSKDYSEHSPLRILERSIHGGLGRGNLGVVMARAGAGKTAFLIQVGLDDLLRDRQVFHVALGQSLEHVHAWYDALFDDLVQASDIADADEIRASMGKNRIIQTYADPVLTPARLEKAAALYGQHLAFRPSAILIDGFNWDAQAAESRASLASFKAFAKELDAELWISAQTHRSVTREHPTTVTLPCEPYVDLIDVAIFLEPQGTHCTVRLLKDHGDAEVPETHLLLDCATLRICEDSGDIHTAVRLPAIGYTLLSGGAEGAEAEFGACAERWGVEEMNFTFAGRQPARRRGLVELSETELKQGGVSQAYVETQLHRSFAPDPDLQKVLKTIWHQVSSAAQVFVIGSVLHDGTVKGGTGWAAELARHFKKELHVFDQEKKAWMSWTGKAWHAGPAPRIERARFTGTGTRFLSDDGKEAIRDLFLRSFGPPTGRRPSSISMAPPRG